MASVRRRLLAAQAELLELRARLRRGELFEGRRAVEAWTQMLMAFKAQALALPRAIAERVCREAENGPQAVEALLRDAVRDLLTTLSEWTPPTAPEERTA
jgi:hypothetical protein